MNETESKQVLLYDCTLRDGAQGPGIHFSLQDKLRLVRALDDFGMDYIEAGWPGSNPKDTALFQELSAAPLSHATLVAFGSTHRVGVAPAEDASLAALAACCAPVIAIVGKGSARQAQEVLGISPEENLSLVRESVEFLRKSGKRVFLDAEHFFDGYAEDSSYATTVLLTAWEAGAECLVLCDTNGGTLPYDVARTVCELREALPAQALLAIHCHNDADCAVAASLSALRSGCAMVQGAVNGFGERCGNANLCSIIPALAFKMPGYSLNEGVKVSTLTPLSRLFYEVTLVRELPQQPYVGAGAFAHKAGLHVAAVAKSPRNFEQIPPEAVGNHRRVLLSELSGSRSVQMKAHEVGVELTPQNSREVLRLLKDREAEGYAYEAADASFQLLLRRHLTEQQPPFELDGFRVIIEKRGPQEKCLSAATLKVRVNGRESEITAAEGEGPVDALDKCLRKALLTFFPDVSQMRLRDFKVRIIDGAAGTAAHTRVLIDSTDGQKEWSTVGLSENIIEAAWQALQDSVEFFLTPKAAPAAEPPQDDPSDNDGTR